MKALTTKKERETVMKTHQKTVSKTTTLLFPIVITIVGGLIAPKGLPLLATIMLGNLMKESGVVSRLTKAAENEISNIVTLLLGISIGATMSGPVFFKPTTLIILCLGLVAICLDTVCGVLFGKVLYYVTGGKDQSAHRGSRDLGIPHVRPGCSERRTEVQQEELSSHARHGRKCRRSGWLGHGGGGHALRFQGHGSYIDKPG